MQLQEAVDSYLKELKNEGRADYRDTEFGLGKFMEYLTDWTPAQVKETGGISAVYFQEFFSWWYIRNCRTNPTVARHLMSAMREFCKFVYRRFDVDILQLYQPVYDELKDDLPRVITLQHAISPANRHEYLRYMTGIKEGDDVEADYDDVADGYMEVVYLGEGAEVELEHIGENVEIGPVRIPLEVARLIRQGDIIHLELGLRNGVWEIIDSGFAYPALARHFLG